MKKEKMDARSGSGMTREEIVGQYRKEEYPVKHQGMTREVSMLGT